MKGDLHVRFREKFEVKVLLLTRLEGEKKSPLLDFPACLWYTNGKTNTRVQCLKLKLQRLQQGV